MTNSSEMSNSPEFDAERLRYMNGLREEGEVPQSAEQEAPHYEWEAILEREGTASKYLNTPALLESLTSLDPESTDSLDQQIQDNVETLIENEIENFNDESTR